MILTTVGGYKSFTASPIASLPDFVVLTGENGAGKTQFLEALRDGVFTGDWQQRPGAVRLLTSADLSNPASFSLAGQVRESRVAQFEQQVRSFVVAPGGHRMPDPQNNARARVISSGLLSAEGIERAETAAGKSIWEWDHSDYVLFTPLEVNGDLFNLSLADLFGNYVQLRTMNRFNRWLETDLKLPHEPWRGEDDLLLAFGPPPWDLLNSTLESINLPYRFEAPEPSITASSTPPLMRDIVTGRELSTSVLSSGEQTLLAIAMSLYSANHRRGAIHMPELVLLDEPDSTLHPSMVRSLLDLLEGTFVSGLKVRVIITTHSPTTVALAPDSSLYIMERDGQPRLHPAVSKDDALARLLVGVPTLSVNIDHRRLVFVESPNDQRTYSKLFEILKPLLVSERSLVFVPAGGNGLADGADAVVGIVSRLREKGNLAVWGLVDRDDASRELTQFVYADSSRYTLENFLFDPITLGLLLLSEPVQKLVERMPGTSYIEFAPVRDSQMLADSVTQLLRRPGDDETKVEVRYSGGFTCQVESFLLETNGHNLLDERILPTFPELRKYPGQKLADLVLDRVWAGRPELIPCSSRDLVARFLAA